MQKIATTVKSLNIYGLLCIDVYWITLRVFIVNQFVFHTIVPLVDWACWSFGTLRGEVVSTDRNGLPIGKKNCLLLDLSGAWEGKLSPPWRPWRALEGKLSPPSRERRLGGKTFSALSLVVGFVMRLRMHALLVALVCTSINQPMGTQGMLLFWGLAFQKEKKQTVGM